MGLGWISSHLRSFVLTSTADRRREMFRLFAHTASDTWELCHGNLTSCLVYQGQDIRERSSDYCFCEFEGLKKAISIQIWCTNGRNWAEKNQTIEKRRPPDCFNAFTSVVYSMRKYQFQCRKIGHCIECFPPRFGIIRNSGTS